MVSNATNVATLSHGAGYFFAIPPEQDGISITLTVAAGGAGVSNYVVWFNLSPDTITWPDTNAYPLSWVFTLNGTNARTVTTNYSRTNFNGYKGLSLDRAGTSQTNNVTISSLIVTPTTR